MKKKLVILGIILIVLIALTILFIPGILGQKRLEENAKERIVEQDDGSKINTSEEFSEVKKSGKIEVRNIQVKYDYGLTIFTGEAYNISDSRSGLTDIILHILDENGKELNKFEGMLPELDPGEMIYMNYSLDMEIPLAYDLKVEVHEHELTNDLDTNETPIQDEVEEIDAEENIE